MSEEAPSGEQAGSLSAQVNDRRIAELESQLALTRQELDSWRGTVQEVTGGHVVQGLLHQLAERDREVLRLRTELETALLEGEVPAAVAAHAVAALSTWPITNPSGQPPEGRGGGSITARSLGGHSARSHSGSSIARHGNQSCEQLDPESISEAGSQAARRPPPSDVGSSIDGARLRRRESSAGSGSGSHRWERRAVASRDEAARREDEGTRREGLEQWLAGVSSSSPRTLETALSPRSSAALAAAVADAGGADDGAGAAPRAGSTGDISPRDGTSMPRELEERRDQVLQLEEEIHSEIARHRELCQSHKERPAIAACSDPLTSHASPGQGEYPPSAGAQSPPVPCSARSALSAASSNGAAQSARPLHAANSPQPQLRKVLDSSQAETAWQSAPTVNELSNSSSTTTVDLHTESGGSPELAMAGSSKEFRSGRSASEGGDAETIGDTPPGAAKSGGALVACSLFVEGGDDDGRKELRRRRFEKQQLERRCRSAREQREQRPEPAGMHLVDDDRSSDGASRQQPLAVASSRKDDKGEIPSSPHQVNRDVQQQYNHRRDFAPTVRAAAGNTAAIAAAAATAAMAAVSARQEQRHHFLPHRQRVVGHASPPRSTPATTALATPAATGDSQRTHFMHSPRSSPRPHSPRGSPRRSPGPGYSPRTSPRAAGHHEDAAPSMPSRSAPSEGSRAQASAPRSSLTNATGPGGSSTLVPALRSKFTEMRDEMKRRRSAASPTGTDRARDRRSGGQPSWAAAVAAGGEAREDSPIKSAPATSSTPARSGGGGSSEATRLCPPFLERGRPSAGQSFERGTAAATARDVTRKDPPAESRGQQSQSSRTGGRSPRPGTGSNGGYMRGRGSPRGGMSPSAAPANASSGGTQGLWRCPSARRVTGTTPSGGGRRPVPPISGLLSLRQSSPSSPPPSRHGASPPPSRHGAPLTSGGGGAGSIANAAGAAVAAMAAEDAAIERAQSRSATERDRSSRLEATERVQIGSRAIGGRARGSGHVVAVAAAAAAAGTAAVARVGVRLDGTVGGTNSSTSISGQADCSASAGSGSATCNGGVLVVSPNIVTSQQPQPQQGLSASTAAALASGVPTPCATPLPSPRTKNGGLASPRVAGSAPEEPECDLLHQAVVQFLQQRPAGRQPLVRSSPGIYEIGTEKLALVLENGRLMVQVGGGLVHLSETLLASGGVPATAGLGAAPLAEMTAVPRRHSAALQASSAGSAGYALPSATTAASHTATFTTPAVAATATSQTAAGGVSVQGYGSPVRLLQGVTRRPA